LAAGTAAGAAAGAGVAAAGLLAPLVLFSLISLKGLFS